MSSSSVWSKLSDLPREDQKLLRQALAFVREQPVPQIMFLEMSHSGEMEHWRVTDLSSLDALATTIWASTLLALSDSGTAYYLPALLALCFVRKDGHFQQQLVDHLESTSYRSVSCLASDSREICLTLIERVQAIAWTLSQELMAAYPGLAVARNREFEDALDGLAKLAERLAPAGGRNTRGHKKRR